MTSLASQYLRKCRICGLEAHNEEDLKLFADASDHLYHKQNLCIPCHKQRMKVLSRNCNSKRIEFQGKNISFKENPRTNVCSVCGRKYPDELKEQTCIHHTKYDPEHPLDNTVELCRSCHLSIHHSGENSPCWKGDNVTEITKRRRLQRRDVPKPWMKVVTSFSEGKA